jgi:hypothetical protein
MPSAAWPSSGAESDGLAVAERSARNGHDPIVVALGLALREIAERKALERAERRRTMTVVDGGKRGGQAA